MIDRSQFRTKSIGVRVSESDFTKLQEIADLNGKPLGEWCRDVLLEVARHPAGTPIEQAVLAELIGLRTIRRQPGLHVHERRQGYARSDGRIRRAR